MVGAPVPRAGHSAEPQLFVEVLLDVLGQHRNRRTRHGWRLFAAVWQVRHCPFPSFPRLSSASQVRSDYFASANFLPDVVLDRTNPTLAGIDCPPPCPGDNVTAASHDPFTGWVHLPLTKGQWRHWTSATGGGLHRGRRRVPAYASLKNPLMSAGFSRRDVPLGEAFTGVGPSRLASAARWPIPHQFGRLTTDYETLRDRLGSGAVAFLDKPVRTTPSLEGLAVGAAAMTEGR